jgi:hypothetical protein
MSRKRAIFLFCVLTVVLGAGSERIAAAERRSLVPQQDIEPTFLGFELGEEVRYVLEREDGQRHGMQVIWSMRLEEFDGEQGVFDFTYDVGTLGSQGRGGRLLARSEARAWVNAYGFPTRVRFTTQRETPMGGLQYTIDYLYEEDRFIKKLEATGDDQDAKLEDFRTVDLGRPAGMYLFMPVDGECVAAARRARGAGAAGGAPPGGSTGGGGTSGGAASGAGGSRGRRPADMEQPCQGREPMFANPGLLNLTMPALWEAGTGSIEFLAMAPTGIIPMALMGGGNPSGGSGISVGGFNMLGGGGPDPFGDAEDAFQMFSLSAEGDLMQIDVGGRPVDVWKMRASAPLDAVYVDGQGSIVRLDLPADPETGERYWIRRLRPSEY